MSTTDTIKIMMWAFIAMIIGVVALNSCGITVSSPVQQSEPSDIDKIIAAQDYVRNYVAKYPDTLDFYDWTYSPKVNGNTVTLKFSCKNAFGVQETHIMDIEVQ